MPNGGWVFVRGFGCPWQTVPVWEVFVPALAGLRGKGGRILAAQALTDLATVVSAEAACPRRPGPSFFVVLASFVIFVAKNPGGHRVASASGGAGSG